MSRSLRLTIRARGLRWRLCALACTALMLTACVGPGAALPQHSAEVATPEPTSMPAGMASPSVSEPTIGEIVWTTSVDASTNEPTDTVSRYSGDAPSIIAAAPAAFLPEGASVDAHWLYNDTTLDNFATRLVADGSPGQRWIAFRLDRDPEIPWPAGIYEVSIMLDGTEVQHAAIEVTDEA